MPDLSPSAIANLARCFNQCVPAGSQLAVSNFILSQIWKANDPMADISPAVILEGARCFNQCIPDGMQLAVMNYTLAQILVSGGGGGGGGLAGSQHGAGPPPTDGSWTTLIWKNDTTGIVYVNMGNVLAPDPQVI